MTTKTWAFEDFVEGALLNLGSELVTAEEAIEFASEFDAQPMHLDEEAGKRGILGDLSASGWLTAAIWVKYNLAASAGCARWTGPGPMPVFGPSPRPQKPQMAKAGLCRRNDPLYPHGCRPSAVASRPGWKLLTIRAEGFDATGATVIQFEPTVMVKIE